MKRKKSLSLADHKCNSWAELFQKDPDGIYEMMRLFILRDDLEHLTQAVNQSIYRVYGGPGLSRVDESLSLRFGVGTSTIFRIVHRTHWKGV